MDKHWKVSLSLKQIVEEALATHFLYPIKLHDICIEDPLSEKEIIKVRTFMLVQNKPLLKFDHGLMQI